MHESSQHPASTSQPRSSEFGPGFELRVRGFERTRMSTANGTRNFLAFIEADLLRIVAQLGEELEEALRRASEMPLLKRHSALGRYVGSLDALWQCMTTTLKCESRYPDGVSIEAQSRGID